MTFTALIKNLLLPHEGNNHRAKLIHPISINLLIVFFLGLQTVALFLPGLIPHVFGYSSTITPEKIVELTNKKRAEDGVGELQIDTNLTKAALAKGSDMFARNYWAHNSPDGQEPWHFFIEGGYQYKYAGENLARDFEKSEDVVDAWIASPTHKENLAAARYQDIGVAVIDGELNGVKTTLVVQLFGTKLGAQTQGTLPGSQKLQALNLAGLSSIQGKSETSITNQLIRLNPFSLKKKIALVFVSIFAIVFFFDLLLIQRNNQQKKSSHSFAHFIFLLMILITIIVAKSGVII